MLTRVVQKALWHPALFENPVVTSASGVFIVFFAPLVGVLLFSIGLLMLYFEKLVYLKHQLATHDELTKLLNSRALVSNGEREFRLALQTNQPLAVAYLDIDHFKRVNDNLGHENGDLVLAELAEILKDVCRMTDHAGRHRLPACAVLQGLPKPGSPTQS